MKSKIFILLLAIILTACAPAMTSAPTVVTSTFSPSIEASTALSPSLPMFPLDGYVMTFFKDGNLYFQDENNVPVKLAHIGEKTNYTPQIEGMRDYLPEISSDNLKVIFYQYDNGYYAAYSINVDGSEERPVLTGYWLDSLEPGTETDIHGFIPNTHKALLMTYLCKSQERGAPCSTRLYTADTDTGEISNLADLGLSYHHYWYVEKSFVVSPDGRMLAVGTMDGIDIFTMDGKMLRENILPYTPSTTIEYPKIFWLPDSSGLILALPDKIYKSLAYNDVVAYSIWRYSIKDDAKIQVPMDVPPMYTKFEVSPDGNWGLYGGFGQAEPSLYLADLTTGKVQVFAEDEQPSFSWGPGSKHFFYGTALQFMRSLEEPASDMFFCYLVQWVDTNHFTCGFDEVNDTRLRMIETNGMQIKKYDLGVGDEVEFWIFVKAK